MEVIFNCFTLGNIVSTNTYSVRISRLNNYYFWNDEEITNNRSLFLRNLF